ncbi:MAG: 2'-5' RNA ligase family protein [Acidobacteriota bacterium]|nr:2'-5' RNA ligase family protein [Acidobacteriota bacterium]
MQSFGGEGPLACPQPSVGHFALVSYIPDPLARFLDDLRLELTPDCNPHAHVTILPPRPVSEDLKETVLQLREGLRNIPAFRTELGDVEVFGKSSVIYLGLRRGQDELRQLYKKLNQGVVEYRESFPYHPHITIGQNIPPEEVERKAAVAREKWAAWTGPRGFDVSVLSFVQQVAPDIWTDVASLPLTVRVLAAG